MAPSTGSAGRASRTKILFSMATAASVLIRPFASGYAMYAYLLNFAVTALPARAMRKSAAVPSVVNA